MYKGHRNLVEDAIKKGGFENPRDLIAAAYQNNFEREIEEALLQAYVELYHSRKVILDWVWFYCISVLNISEGEADKLTGYPTGVTRMSDVDIKKCSNCGLPLVYAAYSIPNNDKVHFCSSKCLPTAIDSKNEVA